MSRPAGAPTRRDKNPLPAHIGSRLRSARHKAGLTQQQLAGERYTKAYISALENSLIRPSVTALDYLAGRLGTTASDLMADERPVWSRLDADLQLAAGDWQAAADSYRALLEQQPDRSRRAELLRGLAEALARQERGAEAARAAGEAVELFDSAGREADAALAAYWLSAALYAQENVGEAKAILLAVLGKVRAGLRVEPDFKLRLVTALSSNEAREGNHHAALSYLEEIRGLADNLDNRRRANFLSDLARSYRETGDFEAAIRAGQASLGYFAAVAAEIETAKLENDLALSRPTNGNTARASEVAADAHRDLGRLGHDRLLAHVLENEAGIGVTNHRNGGSFP
jgi:transcriptional regulator with XRE-family HTH domain